MNTNNEIMVSISCTAYNHERYIAKAIESFLMQKTQYKYEIIIHDDASTDRTADIIREYEKKYPDIIHPIYQTENQYSQGRSPVQIIFNKARGKYIAICEGDDFWTDENKLQKQVEFLESNDEYVASVHAAHYARENGDFICDKQFRKYDSDRDITLNDIFAEGWLFATNSIVYRKSCRTGFIIPFRGQCKNGDFAMAVYFANKGKIFYFESLMSAYRIESIGSINWVWKADLAGYKKDRIEFLNMLDRIDEYLSYKYSTLIKELKLNVEFQMYVYLQDLKTVKSKFPEKYKAMPLIGKAKLYFVGYVPFGRDIYRFAKKIRKKILSR